MTAASRGPGEKDVAQAVSERVWTYANLWESVAAAIPEAFAVVQGERVLTWAEFDCQADAFAAFLRRGAAAAIESGRLRRQLP